MLWPGRRGADGDGCGPRAGLPQPRLLPRRAHGARPRRVGAGHRDASRGSDRAHDSRSGGGGPRDRQREHGVGSPDICRREGQGAARTLTGRVRRRRARSRSRARPQARLPAPRRAAPFGRHVVARAARRPGRVRAEPRRQADPEGGGPARARSRVPRTRSRGRSADAGRRRRHRAPQRRSALFGPGLPARDRGRGTVRRPLDER